MNKKTFKLASGFAGFGAAMMLSACFDAGQAPAGDNGNAKVDPRIESQIEAAELNGTEKPQLDKFVKIPKIGETVGTPRISTTDGDFVYIDGQWRPDVLPLAKSNIQRSWSGYVAEIGLAAGSTSGTTCPAPYFKMDVDLNRRAGGKWIFPCILPGSASQALYMPSVSVWAQGTYGNGPGRLKGITSGTNGDMNQGASGKFIFGNYSNDNRGHLCRMAGVGFVTDPIYPWAAQDLPGDYTYLSLQDINEGAGGDFIYMIGRYDANFETLLHCPRID